MRYYLRRKNIKDKLDDLRLKLRYSQLKVKRFQSTIDRWRKRNSELSLKIKFRNQRIVRLIENNKASKIKLKKNNAIKIKEIKDKYKKLEKSVSHITKVESLKGKLSKNLHIEIIARTIVSYRDLVDKGVIEFNELALLIIGNQFEYFSLKDVENRFGKIFFIKRDLSLCIKAGFINKIEKKSLYYITIEGKNRLNSIINHIYSEKGLGNRTRINTRNDSK